MEVILYGTPDDFGKIVWEHDDQVHTYLDKYIGRRLVFDISPADSKSKKKRMYDYYHKAILDAAMLAFTAMGWQSMDKYKADILLKNECAKDVFINEDTGEEVVFTLDKKTMSKERLHKFLSDCIIFLEIECGIIVISGEEWKLNK